ncbi:hypothetical protein ACFWMG_13055 [Streptomyces sp. NPDC127074]|uniref:hypothetical protein n=1 Tax=Streptomyces sp. NPDC127074 TaxID=3347130 RepID=UPI00364A6541
MNGFLLWLISEAGTHRGVHPGQPCHVRHRHRTAEHGEGAHHGQHRRAGVRHEVEQCPSVALRIACAAGLLIDDQGLDGQGVAAADAMEFRGQPGGGGVRSEEPDGQGVDRAAAQGDPVCVGALREQSGQQGRARPPQRVVIGEQHEGLRAAPG